MTEDTDARLVSRCRGGDRHAFDTLLDRHARQVFSAVFRILHNREDAFDVTQTAFLTAYEHLDRYDPAHPFGGWLYRIAVNRALDLARTRHPAETLSEATVDDHERPEELAMRDEDDGVLQHALMELKIEYRTVIVLRHVQGCSYEEMASILDCEVKTVKSRLFTARQALRAVLVAKGWSR